MGITYNDKSKLSVKDELINSSFEEGVILKITFIPQLWSSLNKKTEKLSNQGYILQRIEREDESFVPQKNPTINFWEKHQKLVADYWELWEAVNCLDGFPRVYPAGLKGTTDTVFSAGIRTINDRANVDKKYIKPTMPAFMFDKNVVHDQFAARPLVARPLEDNLKYMTIKGTVKITGTVYFIPKETEDIGAAMWLFKYKTEARRFQTFGTVSGNKSGGTMNASLSGGILLAMNTKDIGPQQSKYKVMTRKFEAEYSQVKEKDTVDSFNRQMFIAPKPHEGKWIVNS